jgi:hypothetical protein
MPLIDPNNLKAATGTPGWHVLELTWATVCAVAVTELNALNGPVNHRHFSLQSNLLYTLVCHCDGVRLALSAQDFHPVSVAQESEQRLVERRWLLHGRDVSAIQNHNEFRTGDTGLAVSAAIL